MTNNKVPFYSTGDYIQSCGIICDGKEYFKKDVCVCVYIYTHIIVTVVHQKLKQHCKISYTSIKMILILKIIPILMLTTPKKGQVLVNTYFITQSAQDTGKKLKKAAVRTQIPMNKLLVLTSVVSNNRDRLEEAKRIQRQQ